MVPSVTSVEGKPVKPMNDPIHPHAFDYSVFHAFFPKGFMFQPKLKTSQTYFSLNAKRPESTMNTETAKIRAWVIVGSSSAALTAATESMNGQSLASNGARKSTPWSRAKPLSPRIAWTCLARPSQIRAFLQFRKRCINQTLNLPCSICVIGKGLICLATDART